jgi:large subunit ribosomal protein L29
VRAKELRERSVEDLVNLHNEARDNLFQARLKNATHQLDNTATIKIARREIARINTVLAERSSEATGVSDTEGQEE